MLPLRDIDCALHMTLGRFIGVESCVALVAKLVILDLYSNESLKIQRKGLTNVLRIHWVHQHGHHS